MAKNKKYRIGSDSWKIFKIPKKYSAVTSELSRNLWVRPEIEFRTGVEKGFSASAGGGRTFSILDFTKNIIRPTEKEAVQEATKRIKEFDKLVRKYIK